MRCTWNLKPFVVMLFWLWVVLLSAFSNHASGQTSYKFNHFSARDGLPAKPISKVYPDKEGFVWLGTQEGLYRHDGYEVQYFPYTEADAIPISEGAVLDMLEYPEGQLWVAAVGGALAHLDTRTRKWKAYWPVLGDTASLSGWNAVSLHKDKEGALWIGTYDNGLSRMDMGTGRFRRYDLYPNAASQEEAFLKNSVIDIIDDLEDPNILWLATNQGISRFDKNTGTSEHFKSTAPDIENLHFTALSMRNPGVIWAATHGGGLVKFAYSSLNWTHFVYDQPGWDSRSIKSNIVWDMAPAAGSNWWVATEDKGLGIFDAENKVFSFFSPDADTPTSIGAAQARSLTLDANGRLWIAHFQRGYSLLESMRPLFLNEKFPAGDCLEKFENFVKGGLFDAASRQYFLIDASCSRICILNDRQKLLYQVPIEGGTPDLVDIKSFVRDRKGGYWLGGLKNSTQGNQSPVFYWDGKSSVCRPYQHPYLDTAGLSVNCLLEDAKGRILLGTERDGLLALHPATGRIETIIKSENYPEAPESRNPVTALFADHQGMVWMGTQKGRLFRLDTNTDQVQFIPTYRKDGVMAIFVDTRIRSIVESPEGRLWIGTQGQGITLLHTDSIGQAVKVMDRNSGLVNNNIESMSVDRAGNLWIMTQAGLCCIREGGKYQACFDAKDGISGDVFWGARIQTLEDGQILLSYPGLHTVFNPEYVLKPSNQRALAFRYFKIFDTEWEGVRDINLMQEVVLRYNQDFFSIGFGLLDYFKLEKIQYAYQLEGYDRQWNYTGYRRNVAAYTKVPPGSYVFRVKSTDRSGLWQENERSLVIKILPPWWRTWWAMAVWLFAPLLVSGFIWRGWKKRQAERRENQRLKELDEVKAQLYNNITHEFRTPLTIVLGSLDRLIRGTSENGPAREALLAAQKNSRRLLDLINQILDLRKLESGQERPAYFQEDLFPFLKYLVSSFVTLAEQKGIYLEQQFPAGSLIMDIDRDKWQKIVSNLLSNAVKFTGSSGRILFQVSNTDNIIRLVVKDTGIGIPPAELTHIFQRYYQVNHPSFTGAGTGIGLALTKELVELMGGKIFVESIEGVGSAFTVSMPIRNNAPVRSIAEHIPAPDIPFALENATNSADISVHKKQILLVDDSEDIRLFISGALSGIFDVITAADGMEGIEKAQEFIPDIIISDVVMPKLDGFGLLEKVKSDPGTSHIPFIMLTAKVDAESRLSGLRRGANVYLPKPFEMNELLLHLRNLVQLQEALRAGLSAGKADMVAENQDIAIENAFLKRLESIILQHLDDCDFGPELLSRAVNMSHTQLNRKLNILTGHAANLLIRKIRLEQALLLLKQQELSIAEIAYRTGFNDPSYFARVFARMYGSPPTEYREGLRKGT